MKGDYAGKMVRTRMVDRTNPKLGRVKCPSNGTTTHQLDSNARCRCGYQAHPRGRSDA